MYVYTHFPCMMYFSRFSQTFLALVSVIELAYVPRATVGTRSSRKKNDKGEELE